MAQARVHIFYSGRVQGVGFRYTARSIAVELGLTGWVKNLRDGRVEVMCEGEDKKLKRFIEAISGEFPGHYIWDTDITWEQPSGEFDSFDIKF